MKSNLTVKLLAILGLSTLALSACAEVSTNEDVVRPRDVPTATSDVPTVPPTDMPVVGVDVPNGNGARVVINEIRGETEDWIELVNVGTASADLSNWAVTDTDGDGDARVGMLARFPAGTMLAPAAYLLVVVDQADAATSGPGMRCLMSGGPMTCYYSGFGISASRGENVFLLNSSGAIVEAVNYPMNAAMAGESWGRLPNGTGMFARNRLTPGAANEAP